MLFANSKNFFILHIFVFSNVFTKQGRQNRGHQGGLAPPPPPNIFQQSESGLFQKSRKHFLLAWHKVKSCFRCIPSKIMIKFACSVMWVIVYHDISWWMYVNSLVVFWSNRTILWIILARTLSTAFLLIHENEWTSSFMIFLKSCVYIFSHSRGFKIKIFPWRVGPNYGGASYVTNLKCPFQIWPPQCWRASDGPAKLLCN